MLYNCIKCRAHGYYRKGSATGEKVESYTHYKRIVLSKMTYKRSSHLFTEPFCIDCLHKLAMWITDKDTAVDFRK